MKNINIIDTKKITLPFSVIDTLFEDARNYEIYYRGELSLSGIINILLPNLIQYREDLYKDFLQKNNDDETLVLTIMKNIFNNYFNFYKQDLEDSYRKSYRINKPNLDLFMKLENDLLDKYGMNLENYIRTLLVEYSSKKNQERELLYYYNYLATLKECIDENYFIKCMYDSGWIDILPLNLENFNGINIITGLYEENNEKEVIIIPLSRINHLMSLSKKYKCSIDEMDKYLKDKKTLLEELERDV